MFHRALHHHLSSSVYLLNLLIMLLKIFQHSLFPGGIEVVNGVPTLTENHTGIFKFSGS